MNALRTGRAICLAIALLLPSELPAQARAWQINASGNVEMLFVDPAGRRVGRDPRIALNDGRVEEIPGVHYSTFSAGDLEESPADDDSREMLIDPGVPRPAGEYRVDIIGLQSGIFWCDYALMVRGKPIFRYLVRGLIAKDSVRSLRLLYAPGAEIIFSVVRAVGAGDISSDITSAEQAGMIATKGLATSLRQKAANAERSSQRGNVNAAVNTLEALINEVTAQRGKGITPEAADAITADCRALIDGWSEDLP